MGIARPRRRIAVATLGDLGRSPRMLNHAWAAAEAGHPTTLVGYSDSPLDRATADHSRIDVTGVRQAGRAPEGSSRLFVMIYSLGKGVVLALRLFGALRRTRANAFVVQNPPSLPTLPATWLAARLSGAHWIVDWHNFGYSMLALRLGESSGFVALMRRFEYFFARRADGHLCVSQAMADRLRREAGLEAAVLYDLPRDRPAAITAEERRRERDRLAAGASDLLVVCPTSWTADEDVDLLIDALELRERQGATASLEVVITGKGPRKATGEARIAALSLEKTTIRTAFLSPEDYRGLLRAADVGVSLHCSASGVDLPMKVVDLFCERTPVAAFDYGPVLAEQVEMGVTGWGFRTAEELAALLDRLAERKDELALAREAVEDRWRASWGEAWAEAWTSRFPEATDVR